MKKFIFILFLFFFALAIWNTTDSVLERKSYSENFGEISVKKIKTKKFSLATVVGMGSVFYRCDYSQTPGQTHQSSLWIDEESFYPSKFQVVWESHTKATVYADGAPYVECINGIWQRFRPN